MPYWLKTLIFYVSTLILLRFAGKRALAQMGVLEAVVMIALGTLLVHPLKSQSTWISLYGGALLILGLILLSSLQVRFPLIKRWIMGEPLLLIKEGKLQAQNLKRARVTEDEVKMHLRINRVKQLSHVKYATLETSGDLGIEVFPEHALATSKDIEEIKLALEIIAENLKIGPLFTSEKSSAQGQTSEDNLFIQAIHVQDKDPLH